MDMIAGYEAALLSATSPRSIEDEAGTADFAAALLHALTVMAQRSRRSEAELQAAMHRSRLSADPARIDGALRLLKAQGCVKNLVPLTDGGLLLIVTGVGLSRIAADAAETRFIPDVVASEARAAVAPPGRVPALEAA